MRSNISQLVFKVFAAGFSDTFNTESLPVSYFILVKCISLTFLIIKGKVLQERE